MTGFAYALRLVLFCGKLRLLESRARLAGNLQGSSVSKHLKPNISYSEHCQGLKIEDRPSLISGIGTFDCMLAST